jgi:Fe-S cluster assembly protein SufD
MSYNAYHLVENTLSNLSTKGALKDESNGLSRSLIWIGDKANNSEGYESQNALILSKDAKANAIPKLEIKNPNVKCSHGSTIGQVNKEDIFYLMSRGLSKNEAIKLIVLGYFNSILNNILEIKDLKEKEDYEKYKEKIINTIEENINS